MWETIPDFPSAKINIYLYSIFYCSSVLTTGP